MKKLIHVSVILSAVLFLPACTLGSAPAREVHSDAPRDLDPQVAEADLAQLAAGNNEFAFDLFRRFSEEDGNIFYSPYSVSVALAMTYAGARGQTAEQMAGAMHFDLPAESLHPAFNKLALVLDSRSKAEGVKPDQAFQLSVANSLWGQSGFHFERDFLDALARNYAAGMRLVDYQRDAEGARREINDWVGESTNRKIQDIIPEGALDALTRLVLANAVYFKAAWLHAFDTHYTQPRPFHALDGSSRDVPMMSQQGNLRCMSGTDFRAVELPYVGWQLSMLILLPDEGQFDGVESRLNAGLLAGAVDGLQGRQAFLTMPKFKFEWSAELSDGLQALGMRDAFDPSSADFSGMDGERDLYISKILHKAFIAVDEAGTEAAAATVVIVGAMAAPEPVEPLEIKIDRPFFFLIRDNPTGTILFLGRVMNPSA
jgi:serpin B